MQGQKPVRDTNEWFRKDIRLKKKVRSMPKDYHSSKFDRGHFAPAGICIIMTTNMSTHASTRIIDQFQSYHMHASF